MTDIVTLTWQDNPVRTEIGDDGQTVVIAIDVCRAIGVRSPERAYARLDPEDKVMRTTHDLNGKPQEHLAVTESGLYTLILQSKKPEAKAFRRWITSEVLPSIRKTGRYALNQDPILAMLDSARQTRLAQIEPKPRSCEAASPTCWSRTRSLRHAISWPRRRPSSLPVGGATGHGMRAGRTRPRCGR
jgi:prophage antirepressor-like protein